MIRLWRVAVLAGVAFAASAPAEAQFFFGEPARAERPSARAQKQTQRQAKPARATSSSWWDDDEDDTPAARPAPQQPRRGVKGPAVQSGGARPAISASAPSRVSFASGHAAGSVVIDTGSRSLYYVLSSNTAYRYPVAVGREGFSWTGTQRVSRVAAWPDWHPPAEMRQRQPYLPEKMTGGINNPLGAKAIYLGSTLYRIHGTNNAASIGSASSSGCFRMTNANVTHLASLVGVGTSVHVVRRLPASARRTIAGAGNTPPAAPRSAS